MGFVISSCDVRTVVLYKRVIVMVLGKCGDELVLFFFVWIDGIYAIDLVFEYDKYLVFNRKCIGVFSYFGQVLFYIGVVIGTYFGGIAVVRF